MAATAAEARFRIEYPFLARDSRIVAVDAEASAIVHRAAQRQWAGNARFLVLETPMPAGGDGFAPDAVLRVCDGSQSRLSDELAEADVTVMVGSSAGAEAASLIGRACAERSIMTAGVVLSRTAERVNDAVLALRPYAMVLVVTKDEDDLFELLTALRV
jgi:1-aminocyclopropane-1-carboxylate deaminase/D-cysteine desulfhydrase-like pyridoxal-dependent ACC family enzyme